MRGHGVRCRNPAVAQSCVLARALRTGGFGNGLLLSNILSESWTYLPIPQSSIFCLVAHQICTKDQLSPSTTNYVGSMNAPPALDELRACVCVCLCVFRCASVCMCVWLCVKAQRWRFNPKPKELSISVGGETMYQAAED